MNKDINDAIQDLLPGHPLTAVFTLPEGLYGVNSEENKIYKLNCSTPSCSIAEIKVLNYINIK